VYGAEWVDGFIGGALEFDGDSDYVDAASSEELKLNSAGTISVWTNPRYLNEQSIVNKRGGSAAGNNYENYWLFFGMYERAIVIGDGTDHVYAAIPEEDLSVNMWQHIVGTWDSSEIKIYLNGNLSDAQPNTLGELIRTDAYPVRIGRHGNGAWSFDGFIDDVRVYDRALSGGEVLGLFEAVDQPEAVVYHVDGVGGSDLNDGVSKATAFATVQKGIDSCIDGGGVVVWPGVYSEAINFLGKAITVESGGDAAVIEASGMDAVTFHSGEGAGSVLKNFVIRNSGLGISANYGSSPTVSNLTIVDNDYGIAAYEDSNPDISNCILWDNRDGDMWGCQASYSFVEQEIVTGPVDGLIAQWQFDEGSGTTAGDSAGDNDGAVNGAEWVIGQIGGALSFDGVDDYVSIPDADVFDFNDGDVSIGMWFMTSEYADQSLMKFRDYDDGPILEVYTSTVYGNLGSRAEPGGAIVAYNAGRVDDGDWHHVAVSLENGTTAGYELYFDGTLVGMSTFSGEFSGWDAIAIGNDADGGGYFNGSIDDVRVYGRAISSLEAYLLYEMSRGGPVAHWKFDEGAGSIAYDSAGSNDGVVYGAQWAAGQVGGALDFDGVGDYVDCGNDESLQVSEGTVSAWIKACCTCDAADDYCGIVVKTYAYGMYVVGDNLLVHSWNPWAQLDTGHEITDNAWHHVGFTFESGVVSGTKIYVDGEVKTIGTLTIYDQDDNLLIGHGNSGNQYIDAAIDDVRIYDRALSTGEYELLYEGGLDGLDDVDTFQPQFANAGAGDYHLLSDRGRYWPEHDVWVLDKVSSPCIDGGDPTIEPSREPMPNGGALNMGAYGGTEYASMSEWPIFSDYDWNGRSDFGDFAVFCDEWLITLPWAE